jgi:hypothetical protein
MVRSLHHRTILGVGNTQHVFQRFAKVMREIITHHGEFDVTVLFFSSCDRNRVFLCDIVNISDGAVPVFRSDAVPLRGDEKTN